MKQHVFIACSIALCGAMLPVYAQNSVAKERLVWHAFTCCTQEMEQALKAISDAQVSLYTLTKSSNTSAPGTTKKMRSYSISPLEKDIISACTAVDAALKQCTSILNRQKELQQTVQTLLQENSTTDAPLQEKITALEAENEAYEKLFQQLTPQLTKIITQLTTYSAYFRTLNETFITLAEQQSNFQTELNQLYSSVSEAV